MRRTSFIRAVAGVLISGSISSSAQAITVTTAAGLTSATETLSTVEAVGCWGYGWRGWAWYPGLFRCAGRVYAPPPPAYVVEAAPVYAPPPPPAYRAPRSCWITTDPERNLGYWRPC